LGGADIDELLGEPLHGGLGQLGLARKLRQTEPVLELSTSRSANAALENDRHYHRYGVRFADPGMRTLDSGRALSRRL